MILITERIDYGIERLAHVVAFRRHQRWISKRSVAGTLAKTVGEVLDRRLGKPGPDQLLIRLPLVKRLEP